MSIKKTCIQTLACFIPDKEKRKNFRKRYLGEVAPVNEDIAKNKDVPVNENVQDRFLSIFGIPNQGAVTFKEYMLANNMPEKLAKLKTGLDADSIALLHALLKRMLLFPNMAEHHNFQIRESYYLSLHTPDEHRYIQQFLSESPSYKAEFDLLGGAYNPDTFLFHHGLRHAGGRIKDYVRNKDFIDGGAYIGDSAVVLERYYAPRLVHSFEISTLACEKYVEVMQKNNVPDSKYKLNRLGLSDCAETFMINNNLDQGVSLIHAGDQQVQTTNVDSYVGENNLEVGFIKGDLEGFGVKALRGMEKTIRQFRPVLSLAIYHNPEEFFTMKPLLDAITKDLDYTIKLKHFHPFPDFMVDVVLFAYPRELE